MAPEATSIEPERENRIRDVLLVSRTDESGIDRVNHLYRYQACCMRWEQVIRVLLRSVSPIGHEIQMMSKLGRLLVKTAVISGLMLPVSAHAYIDPGTGSLILQGLVAAIAGIYESCVHSR